MPSTQERVQEVVGEIQTWLATHPPKLSEAIVRQAIVLRLLQAAGFDIWNPTEVVPEETNTTGNRSDFLIRAGKGTFALEVKGMNVKLRPQHYEKVITYAANEGTRWAILTNWHFWIVLDEHLPGPYHKREVLKLDSGKEETTLAADLSIIIDAESWRKDSFSNAIAEIERRREMRLVRQIVKDIQLKYKIPIFELAIQNAVDANKITHEQAILIGNPEKQTNTAKISQPQKLYTSSNTTASEDVNLHYFVGDAKARVVYNPTKGTWTIGADSTALQATKPYAEATQRRREKMLESGEIEEISDTLLRYVKDVEYTSPSSAANDISGASQNGWMAWRDSEGRPAHHYRPSKTN
ncbi:DUF4357 domain-containing protein [Deinococcus sp. YIM 134068]|uniref:DUF4357 domain-containing protein n=1 Tax=Deinococcus lichenicola TaxID=3118910 RepID=UPI002F95C49C